MGATSMMLSMLLAFYWSVMLFVNGIVFFIIYAIHKKRGRLMVRRFIVIPIISVVISVLLLSYSAFWLIVIRSGNSALGEVYRDTGVYASFDENDNIILSGKCYIELGYESSETIKRSAPIANILYDTGVISKIIGRLFEYSGNATLYAVSNGAGSDIISDGMQVYCEQSQLGKAIAYYEDLRNYEYRVSYVENWYDKELNEQLSIDLDWAMCSELGSLEEGTQLELRYESEGQDIVYLFPVSKDGVMEKFYSILKKEEQLFLVFSEQYEDDEYQTAYVCYRLPDDVNDYFLHALFK